MFGILMLLIGYEFLQVPACHDLQVPSCHDLVCHYHQTLNPEPSLCQPLPMLCALTLWIGYEFVNVPLCVVILVCTVNSNFSDS